MLVRTQLDRPPALDLAHAFIDEMHGDASAAEREVIRNMILCAAQYIYEEAGPGQWEALEPVEFLERMAPRDNHARTGLCLFLVGFVAWMVFGAYLLPGDAIPIIERVATVDPTNVIVAGLCASTVETLALELPN